MKFLRETLLGLLVVGVLLYLYVVAATTAVLTLHRFHRVQQPVHDLKMAKT
ncbi:MAG: hypothetical protein ACM3NN_16205 [Nitrospirota bacterium]|jgi:hypothetical protein